GPATDPRDRPARAQAGRDHPALRGAHEPFDSRSPRFGNVGSRGFAGRSKAAQPARGAVGHGDSPTAHRLRAARPFGRSPSRTQIWVLCDRERISQVLSNLIGNATQFTPEGGAVTVRTTVVGKKVQVAVSDTGPGIPE